MSIEKTFPAPLHQVVGQLRKIMERATGAPWEVVARPWATDSGHKCTEWNISTAWIHGQLKDKAGIVSRSIHCTSDERNQHGVWLTKEDADFIVAAANSFPALLEIAEAAAQVQDGMDKRDEDEAEWAAAGTRVSAMEMHDRRMRLARALAALPNPTDHQAPASGALVHPVVGCEPSTGENI